MMLKGMSTGNTRSDSALDLKSKGDTQPVFKSILDTKISEKALTKPSEFFRIALQSINLLPQIRSKKDISHGRRIY